MDALGPDLQTIYNLLHDLKRFPLPQSEHQAEGAAARAEESCVQVSAPRLLLPEGVPRRGKVRGTCSVPGCCARSWDGALIAVIGGDF